MEALAVSVEVSEALQCWWEQEKRKKERQDVTKLVSSSGIPLRTLDRVGSGDSGSVSGGDSPLDSQQTSESTNGQIGCLTSNKNSEVIL